MSIFSKLFGGQDTTSSGGAVNTADAKARIDSPTPPFLLDVREPYEYAEGHIHGAQLLPLGELGKRMGELPRNREILVICRSGNRSGSATRQLAQAGFNAVNLRGGMIGWQRAGYPVRRGK